MLEKLRIQLATIDALPQLALMGVISGLLAGSVIILFRILTESVQARYLPQGEIEHFEALIQSYRLLVPTFGGLLIGVLFQVVPAEARSLGIVHVIERLDYHQGHLPLRNAVLQFLGAAISIISGHSVGREGPCVHLGAASGSLLGQGLALPNNSIRVLVACGSAAGIAASFNTPLAGVVFAMEVVMMEYRVNELTPVILAAVIGAMMAEWIYGHTVAFEVPQLTLKLPLFELSYLMLMGVVIGLLAVLFINILQLLTHYSKKVLVFWQRTTLAGFLIGLCGLWLPQIMGIGYDTVNAALIGQLSLELMILLTIFKLLMTALGLGLGLPGGLIGPIMVVGATAGGVFGALADSSIQLSSPALYVLLGMGAMMSATLQAPLAALTALLELTGNLNVILPGMLVIVIANLIARSPPFNKSSIFLELMHARGLNHPDNPILQSLRRIGVASVMKRNFIIQPRYLTVEQAQRALQTQPLWIIIEESQVHYNCLLLAADLAYVLQNAPPEPIDLLEIPGTRLQLTAIPLQATLEQALEVLTQTQTEALYVVHHQSAPYIYGVLTRQNIETHYLVYRHH